MHTWQQDLVYRNQHLVVANREQMFYSVDRESRVGKSAQLIGIKYHILLKFVAPCSTIIKNVLKGDNDMIETKQMYVADLNVVFGKQEEPLIKWLDEIVLPALQSSKELEQSKRTSYIFENVELNEIAKDEYVIQGILIKDTILDVMSEYSKERGLEKTDKHLKTSPYSIFIIYLRNHRMLLVKNQPGSPDIRSFGAAFRASVKDYISQENKLRREKKEVLLPMGITNVSGIKTKQSVKESLKNVEKIRELTFKFYPLNSEWDYESVFGEIDKKIRKTIVSKNGKMVFPSPKSIDGVAEIIEATEGLAKAEMKVDYNTDLSLMGTKKTGTIKDNEISQVMNIDLRNELDEAYEEVYLNGKDIKALEFQTDNNLKEYQEFLRKRKR